MKQLSEEKIIEIEQLQEQEYKEHYVDGKAARSGVPLMNHIDEGLRVLRDIGASERAIRAYMLRPLLQADGDFLKVLSAPELLAKVKPDVIMLAMEYRKCANAYLCRPGTDGWDLDRIETEVNLVSVDVIHMLYADKIQNRKDFIKHHSMTHPRRHQLRNYFENWLSILPFKRSVDENS